MKTETLHLFLKGYWYDQVLYGDKRIEYRAMTSRYLKQIWERRDTLKTLVLHRGYTACVLIAAIVKIDVGPCPYKGWDGEYYRIYFGPQK